jgi:hypothetical protein
MKEGVSKEHPLLVGIPLVTEEAVSEGTASYIFLRNAVLQRAYLLHKECQVASPAFLKTD